MTETPCKVSVLGTEYVIKRRKFDDEENFAKFKIDGWCDSSSKRIVFCDMRTHPTLEDGTEQNCTRLENEIVRHELIHAFLNESGLQESSNRFDGAWANNEEMVDWIALQFPKIAVVFEKLNIL